MRNRPHRADRQFRLAPDLLAFTQTTQFTHARDIRARLNCAHPQMPPSSTRAPRRLVALVVTLTVVPLAVFLGLGWKLTQQDRAIEAQQRRGRLQLDADRVVAAIDRAVSASEQALAAGRTDWPAGVVVVTFKDGTVDVTPTGRVAYVPAVTPRREVPAETFRAAEILEFPRRDRRAAIAAYRRLTMSQDDAVRAGALLRLARNLNAAGEVDQALDAYAALGAINGVTESAVPVSLAAAWGRCAVLAEHGRDSELRAEASRFDQQLRAGAWRVAEPVYLAYIADAVRWSGTNRTRTSAEVLAAAVSRVWNDARVYRTGSPGSTRRLITVDDDVIAVLTQDSPSTTRMLLAMPSFVSNEWLSAAGSLAAEQRITFAIVPEPEAGSTRLSAAPAGQGLTITSAQNGDHPLLPREQWSDVPPVLESICMRALAKSPNDRFGSASELATAVQSWQEVERLAAQEERDRFFTLSLDMFCIAGFDGYFKRLNGAFERTLGYTVEEMLAVPYLSFIHPDDVERTVAEAQKISTGANSLTFENRYRCKDGSYKWLLWTATPFPTRQSVYAAARDITERKLAEEALRQGEERYRSVIAAMQDGLVVVDAYGSIRTCNASAERILGLSAEQIIDRTARDPRWRAIDADGSPFPSESFPVAVTLRTGQPCSNIIMGVYKPDDTLTWISINSEPAFEADGTLGGVVASFEDITERRRLEEALQQASSKLAALRQ